MIKTGVALVNFNEDGRNKIIEIGCLFHHPEMTPDTEETVTCHFKKIRPAASILKIQFMNFQKRLNELGRVTEVVKKEKQNSVK